MWKIGLLLIVILCASCNLNMSGASTPTAAPPPQNSATNGPQPTRTLIGDLTPTPLQLQPPPIPVTSVPALGGSCQVYLTYSGPEPLNKLSMRAEPSASALQVLRVPNNAQVLLVPNSQEVAAEDYHWLNVLYIDEAGTHFQGWMARDSYAVGGKRDPTIATLRPNGTQAPC